MRHGLWHKRALVGLLALVVGGTGLVVADAPRGSREPAAWPSVQEAPDSGTALAAARRQKSPVRVADLTTETRLVHAKPDGTMAAEMTTVPVRVRQGDGWVPVDTTLVVRPDGSVVPRATVTELAFSGGGDAPLVRYAVGDSRVTLTWPGRLPKPVLTGDTATYAEVYPGVDLVMRANNAGYTQHVVVKSRRAAGAVRDIRLGMATERLTVTVTRDGAIEGRDPGGQGVFRSPPSLMWDSAPEQTRKQALAKVTVGRKALVITPDAKLLADPATTFPVIVDPAPAQLGKYAWGGVYSGNSDRAYYNATADPGGLAQVGRCNWSACEAVVGAARTYFQFDTRWLAGKEFIQARVNTVAVHRPDCNWHNHNLYWVHGQYGPGMSWDVAKPIFNELVNTTGVAGARAGCPDPYDHHFGFNTNGRINFGGFSSYLITATDELNPGAWRKYDQHRTVLYVEYNTKPTAPTELSVVPWRASCANCGGKVYLGDDFLKLRARLSDPDGDQVRPRWTVNGVAAETGWVNSGDFATHDIDTRGKPDQSEYQWSAATADWRDWSGTVVGPSFVTDRKSPLLAPTVASDLYPADNRWHGGTGVPGVFTFTPNFAENELQDIDHYRYGWDDAAPEKVDAPALNAPVSITLTPPGDGLRDLHVYSVDRSGRFSPATVHHFYVRAGNGPLAQWSFEGNAQDTAFLGFRHGTPAGGTVYGPGAVGTGITLNPATQGRVTAPNTVSTKSSFSVSAWVKPASGVTYAAVVSQEGPHFPGFVLWHWLDSTGSPRWVFGMAQDGDTYVGTDSAWSAEPAEAGVWTHLTGVYDAGAKKLRIYVNGVRSGEGSRTVEPWNATGNVQIGRTTWGDNPASHQFPGSIDEVAIWDRMLTDSEVRAAVSRDNVQVGHWRFDELAGTTTATNSVNGGASGVLTGGATFTTPGIVDDSLKLNGSTGAVIMPGPQLRTDRSFTVAGWAEISQQPTASGAATIVSQDGVYRSGFALQYRAISGSPDSGHWWMLMPNADGATAGENTVIASTSPTKVGKRAHVAAVYDATSRVVRLYVDGKLAGEGARVGGFHATGAFTIGRGQWNGQPTDYLPGLVDEVRAYSRPLALAEIEGLVSQNNVTEGQWKLDGGFGDTSGKGRHGTEAETVGFTGGQTGFPDPSDLALALDGNGYVSAPKALDTSLSFSVSAWARLDRVGGHPVVVSQDGAFVSAFQLQATPDSHWAFVLFSHDRADGGDTHHRIVGPAAQVGVWTHLVGVYDAPARQLQLYVNGASVASGAGPVMWNHATGQVQIGAAKWNGQRSDRFPGAIDDVSLYNRVLLADEARAQAGRDLSLVHNWTFDEPSGANASDAVGSRTAALSGGYQREVGRSGNALRFNGSTGAASTSTVDLRTDQSFTVSAWVHMNPVQCADPYVGCRRDAVTVDGAQTSKFRLGHLVDDGDNLNGSWIFEMPESDTSPAVARAAVSVAPGEIKNWVHLVGVYDAPSKTIWLYVNAVRQKDGALNTSWQAPGGVAIGRGRVAGQPANHFPGMVDDVRLYAGVLDKNRVAALKASYPAEAATAPLPTDPIGYWKLDEGVGTTGADASGNNRPVTMTGGSSWIGGRRNAAMSLDGTSAWARTAGPVLDTTGDFSVATWTYLNATTGDRTLVAQDADRVSAFSLRYHNATREWSVLVPSADIDNPPITLLTSVEAVALSEWTHLAVTYRKSGGQLKLYVNGVLSAMRAGVATIRSTGPLTLGRAKWNGANTEFYRYGIDDVRAFGRVLSAGEVRAIHDDANTMRSGRYTFDDGTPRDASWRGNHAVEHTSGVSYGPGLSGRAVVLDGVAGRLAAPTFGVSTRDSFTVSAWANLSRKTQVATVIGQDGDRASSFFLQYRPAPDRWVFGHYQQDADGAATIYAQSLQAPVVGQWTHLAGVYDYAARQLRIYVDGELAGTKEGVALWAGNSKFSIGRSKAGGLAEGFFPGSIDEVLVYQGIQSATEISRMGWPAAPGGQLGRFRNTAGDRYTGSTADGPRAGYHFESTLGALVGDDRPETRPLYACLDGADGFTSTEAACDEATVVGELGRVYTRQPANMATTPIYRCEDGEDRFESRRSDCEGAAEEGVLLGYTLAYGQMGRYSVHGDHWQGVDAAPHGYQYEGPLGWLPLVSQPGTVPLYACRDDADQFLSTDGACADKTVVGVIAEIWPTAPSDMDSRVVYSCRLAGQRFVDFSPTCGGHTVDGPLGYVLRGAFNPSPVFS